MWPRSDRFGGGRRRNVVPVSTSDDRQTHRSATGPRRPGERYRCHRPPTTLRPRVPSGHVRSEDHRWNDRRRHRPCPLRRRRGRDRRRHRRRWARRIDGDAAETIDATGLIVTPGFVDIHTHYDGQATWDPVLDPSASHGVTTVVAGNCGVGFAPVRPGQESWLVELMEGVEDIPGTALHEGIQWEWETFPEYLDALGRREYALDIAAFIPHAPAARLRHGRARRRQRGPATADDIAEMAAHVRAAIEAGAVGFSTSRSLNHTVARRRARARHLRLGRRAHRARPGRRRRRRRALRGRAHRRDRRRRGGRPSARSSSWVRSRSPPALPVSFLMVQSLRALPTCGATSSRRSRRPTPTGARLIPQVAARPGGMLLGVASYHGFMRRPTFRRPRGLAAPRRAAGRAAQARGEGGHPGRGRPAARP